MLPRPTVVILVLVNAHRRARYSGRQDAAVTDAERAQLAGVVAVVREVLGATAVSAYLFGSATLGGLRPHSDLDVLALARRSLARRSDSSPIASSASPVAATARGPSR